MPLNIETAGKSDISLIVGLLKVIYFSITKSFKYMLLFLSFYSFIIIVLVWAFFYTIYLVLSISLILKICVSISTWKLHYALLLLLFS